MKKFAIITICLNTEDVIADTIASVLNQTCTDFEYLIKDGVSKDQTVHIAESFAPVFAEKGISYRVISAPDTGVYDAMNQAAAEIQGEWVLYMNAGDQMANNDVLRMVVDSGYLETADFVYGDRILKRNDRYMYKDALPLERMRDSLPFGHQSVFARKQLCDQQPFSLQYRLCSDYLFFFHWYREGKIFSYIPKPFSIYDVQGLSSDVRAITQELLKFHETLPIRDEETIQMFQDKIKKLDREKFFFEHFTRFIPKKLRDKRREWMKKRNKKQDTNWKTKDEFFADQTQNDGSMQHINQT